jgi:glutamate--cysteine ligase catalytic subunit
VRKHGIDQFLAVYERVKAREGDTLKWGDEVEFHLVRLSGSGPERKATLHLIAPAVLEHLEAEERLGDL